MLCLARKYIELVDPDVYEVPGLDDLNIDGWRPFVRNTGVVLVGFMKRGEQPNRSYEPTVAIRMPRSGAEKSIASTLFALQRAADWAH